MSGGMALLERDAEITRIERVLDAASAGEGSVTVISGEAGVGKTALLEAAVRGSRSVGVRPLLARASELEREFSLGVVRQLLEPPVLELDADERAAAFAGAAAPSATVLDLEAAPDLERDPLATIHGLYWLTVNLSASSPLLLAVDDLQWADEMSLRALAYLARRLDGVGIALVATLRTGEDLTEAAAHAIDEIHGRAETARVEPAGLGDEAVSELLASGLGSDPDRGFAATCRELTGGNPFLLNELAAELATEDVEPSERNRDRVEALVPDRVGQMTRRRLARLSPDARALAEAVSVLGDGEELSMTARMARLDPSPAAAAAGELISSRVFADSPRPGFRHPLLRAAVREEIPGPAAATRHAEAARLLDGAGAPAAKVAPHLLHSPPGAGDAWVVDRLREAARSARSQGATEQAALLLERALSEPPPAEQRAELLEEAAYAEITVLRRSAPALFAEAHEAATDPAAKARLALGRGMAHFYEADHRAAVDVLATAADEAAAEPELREEWLLLEAFLALVGRYEMATKSEASDRVIALGRTLSAETPGEKRIAAFVASLNPGPTADGLVAATDLVVDTLGTAPWALPSEGVGEVAMYVHAGRPDKAGALADRLVENAIEEASPLKHAMMITARALVSVDVGDPVGAISEFEEAGEALREFGSDMLLRGNTGPHATALTQIGETDRAERLFVEQDLAGEVPEQMILNPTLFARSQMRMEQRRFDEAAADLAELGRRYGAWGIARPNPPWRSARALALDALGDREAGRPLAEEELEIATVWDTPKAIATAERALGRLSEGEEALSHLKRAADLLADGPWRLDRARARVDLGAALRRAGQRRRGRELLAEAMDEAHAIGAEPLADLAAEELRASGAHPRKRAISGLDALTPSELRAARLAADGRTNREIAQELFVTIATVETHLTRVYRKLDLDGRDGLAAVLESA